MLFDRVLFFNAIAALLYRWAAAPIGSRDRTATALQSGCDCFRVKLDQYLAGCGLSKLRLAILSATTIIWCNAPHTPVLMSFVQHRLRLGLRGRPSNRSSRLLRV
jgi:hypothetical protein